MSDLQALCHVLTSVNQDADRLAADLAQRAQRLAQAASHAGRASSGSASPDGRIAAQSLEMAATAVQRAAEQLHQVSVAGRGFVSRNAASATGGTGSGRRGEGAAAGSQTPQVQSVADIREWLGDVNPGYTGDPFDPRSSNCGHCAAAVHARLSGGGDYVASASTLSVAEMEAWTGRTQVQMTPSEIEQLLRSNGPGSHVVVGVDRSSGPGHWFNAYFDGDRVVAIDGQTGTIAPWPPDYGDVVVWDAGI